MFKVVFENGKWAAHHANHRFDVEPFVEAVLGNAHDAKKLARTLNDDGTMPPVIIYAQWEGVAA